MIRPVPVSMKRRARVAGPQPMKTGREGGHEEYDQHLWDADLVPDGPTLAIPSPA